MFRTTSQKQIYITTISNICNLQSLGKNPDKERKLISKAEQTEFILFEFVHYVEEQSNQRRL